MAKWEGGRSPSQQRRLDRIPVDKRDDLKAGISSLGRLTADLSPGVGDVMSAKEAYDAYAKGDYGTAALLAALTGVGLFPVGGDAASATGKVLLKSAKERKVLNELVHPEIGSVGDFLTGRVPGSIDQITHGSRNTSIHELMDALEQGAFMPNPANKFAENKKWWSAADNDGIFGRQWNKGGGDPYTVRVPKANLPPNAPALAEHAEVFNKNTGVWDPFAEFMRTYLESTK
jgi:hypothetical protein